MHTSLHRNRHSGSWTMREHRLILDAETPDAQKQPDQAGVEAQKPETLVQRAQNMMVRRREGAGKVTAGLQATMGKTQEFLAKTGKGTRERLESGTARGARAALDAFANQRSGIKAGVNQADLAIDAMQGNKDAQKQLLDAQRKADESLPEDTEQQRAFKKETMAKWKELDLGNMALKAPDFLVSAEEKADIAKTIDDKSTAAIAKGYNETLAKTTGNRPFLTRFMDRVLRSKHTA